MSRYDYNIVVIGGGSGGLVSAYIAAAVKAKVALVEQHRMGGDCLNTGCVPSKALIRTAKFLHDVKRHESLGVREASVTVEFSDVMDRVQRIIGSIAPHDSVERYTKLGVDCYTATARLKGPHEVELDDGRVLTAKNIILATGARPFVPPIKGIENVEILHSDNLWDVREQPRRLAVLGGGPIGSELAQCFARLGSEVTQIERSSQILGREDDDVVDLVSSSFQKDGISLMTGAEAREVRVDGRDKIVVVETDEGSREIRCDGLLVAVGRQARVTGFGAEELGLELTDRKTLAVDPLLRTNIPNIYAVGDVAGPYQFTHTAAHQAWYAAVNALFSPFKTFKVDYSVIPWCTYTDPEVARVGLNEKEARDQGIDHEVTIYDLEDLDRAITDEDASGLVKVITPPGKDRVLGVTICGPHAGDLIAEYVLAMKHGIGLNKILGTIHIYPTLAEANKYAAGNWKKANAPEGLLNFVKKFHGWRR